MNIHKRIPIECIEEIDKNVCMSRILAVSLRNIRRDFGISLEY